LQRVGWLNLLLLPCNTTTSERKRTSTAMNVSSPYPDTRMSQSSESDSQASMTTQMAATFVPRGMNMSQTPESRHQQMDLPQLQSAPVDSLRSQDMLQAHLGIAVSSAFSNECLFLDKLAPEIRSQIYSYLLVNPLLSTGRSASLSPACNTFDSQGLVTKVSNVRYHPSPILLLLLAFANGFNSNVMLTCSAVHVPQRLF
jgi:hypothetical protein